jgi:hypothetical protein
MVFELIRIEQSGLEIGRTQTCLYVARDEHVSLYRDGEDIRSSGLVNGRLMMCRGAVVVCKWTDSPTMDCPDLCLEAFWLQEWEWVLEDCHKRSCWKNPLGMSVPVPCGSDVYVCSKSWWLYLTVVYWLLECNKVPSWIENPEYVTICSFCHYYTDLYESVAGRVQVYFYLRTCKILLNVFAYFSKYLYQLDAFKCFVIHLRRLCCMFVETRRDAQSTDPSETLNTQVCGSEHRRRLK